MFKSHPPDRHNPSVELSTADKAELAILKVLTRSFEKRWIASRPTRECRYDLILDDGQRLHRTQVKYCARKSFHASGVAFLDFTKGGNRNRTYLDHEIDVVLVYVAPADTIAWLGPKYFHKRRNVSIRYEPTKNKQRTGVLLLGDVAW